MHKCARKPTKSVQLERTTGEHIKQYACYTFIIGNINKAQPLQMEENDYNIVNLMIAVSV